LTETEMGKQAWMEKPFTLEIRQKPEYLALQKEEWNNGHF